MEHRLNLLCLDAQAACATIYEQLLRESGTAASCTHLRSIAEMRRLDTDRRLAWDLIVTDASLVDARGAASITLLRDVGYAGPVVIAADTLGDEIAAACILAGAAGFVSKSNLGNFVATVRQALAAEARGPATSSSQQPALDSTHVRFRAIIDSAMDAIISVGEDQRILIFNPAAEKLFGWSSDEVVNKPIDMLIPEQFRLLHREHIIRFGVNRETKRTMRSLGELRALHRSGETFPIEASISQAQFQGTTFFTAIIRDLNERRNLERQLFQAQKMEALAQLSAGVAHDFNNLLGVIFGNSELLEHMLESEHQLQPVRHIRRAAERARDITRRMLVFGRSTKSEPAAISLGEIVREVAAFLSVGLPPGVSVATEMETELDTVWGDGAAIHQIFMNLGANAVYVLRLGGGSLRFVVRTVERTRAALLGNFLLPPGHYVSVDIEDTGPGIPVNALPRIWEPFFTTKPVGEGTGLGLSVVHGLVTELHGGIAVESRESAGTTFSVLLPYHAKVAAEVPLRAAEQQQLSLTLLYVDDEPFLLEVGRQMLEHFGHEVTVFQDPQAAIEWFRTHSKRYDVLIIDRSMPQMSGEQVAAECRKIRADIPIVSVSGDHSGVERLPPELARQTVFLAKPFTFEQIQDAVHTAANTSALADPGDSSGF